MDGYPPRENSTRREIRTDERTEMSSVAALQFVDKIKIRHHRRTCAADDDTDGEISGKIVCEEHQRRVRGFD